MKKRILSLIAILALSATAFASNYSAPNTPLPRPNPVVTRYAKNWDTFSVDRAEYYKDGTKLNPNVQYNLVMKMPYANVSLEYTDGAAIEVYLVPQGTRKSLNIGTQGTNTLFMTTDTNDTDLQSRILIKVPYNVNLKEVNLGHGSFNNTIDFVNNFKVYVGNGEFIQNKDLNGVGVRGNFAIDNANLFLTTSDFPELRKYNLVTVSDSPSSQVVPFSYRDRYVR